MCIGVHLKFRCTSMCMCIRGAKYLCMYVYSVYTTQLYVLEIVCPSSVPRPKTKVALLRLICQWARNGPIEHWPLTLFDILNWCSRVQRCAPIRLASAQCLGTLGRGQGTVSVCVTPRDDDDDECHPRHAERTIFCRRNTRMHFQKVHHRAVSTLLCCACCKTKTNTFEWRLPKLLALWASLRRHKLPQAASKPSCV